MECNRNQSNILNNQELISPSKFINNYNSLLSFTENYIPPKLRKKSRQLSSKLIKETIKYKYSISKNTTIKEDLTKNEPDIKNLTSLSTGKILRTQSRILNNTHDEFLLIKNEYTCRNKRFENLNMDKICGSSYRKLSKDKNKKNKDDVNNNNHKTIQKIDKSDVKENIEVIREYTINYDNKILDENDSKIKLNKDNKEINNTENKYLLTKGDYYSDTNENNINSKNIILNKDKENINDVKFIPKEETEIKNKRNLFNVKHNKIKNLILQKTNIPFNKKYKLFNTTREIKLTPKNISNSKIFSYNHYNCKKKFSEENNKTTNKKELNNKFDFLNLLNFSNNRSNTNKKINNLYLYNKCTYQFKKDKINYKQFLKNRTMSLINRFDNYENNKCIMPPNNLKNILLNEEKAYFDLL